MTRRKRSSKGAARSRAKNGGRTSGTAQASSKRRKVPARGGRRRTVRNRRFGTGPFWRVLRVTAAVAVWGAFLGGLAAIYVAAHLPDTSKLWVSEGGTSVTVLDAQGRTIAARGTSHGRPVNLDDLPDHLIEAVLATEDRRFYEHFGIDLAATVRALIANLNAGRVVQGGSTITQQLAKNLFLTPERTIARKVQEAGLALWLEHRFTKDQILALYLNRVYLGAGTYGVEAAARRYFAKPVSELTLSESAIVAGLLKAPSRYAPTADAAAAAARAETVLALMEKAGFITASERAAADPSSPTVAPRSATPGLGFFTDWVIAELPALTGGARADTIVETTLDLDAQRAAEAAVLEVLLREGTARRAGEAALVALSPEGAVRAMVGGRNYRVSQFNRAVQARRQPGSAFKPFVYLAALERGFTPADRFEDAPVAVGDWRPENFSDRYEGRVRLDDALTESLNTVAVRLIQAVGPSRVVATAHRLGIETRLGAHPSLALGTSEVGVLELAGAYAPFANGGRAAPAHAVVRVRTAEGQVLYERPPTKAARVVARDDLAALNAMLSTAMVQGTGRNAQLPDGRPAAGKTGTSQGFRDAWFAGYTAEGVAVVWVGNDDGSPMAEVTGGSLPAEIWRRFATRWHDGKPHRPLPGWRPEPEETDDFFDRMWRALTGDS